VPQLLKEQNVVSQEEVMQMSLIVSKQDQVNEIVHNAMVGKVDKSIEVVLNWKPNNLLDVKQYPSMKQVIENPICLPLVVATQNATTKVCGSLVALSLVKDNIQEILKLSGGKNAEVTKQITLLINGVQAALDKISIDVQKIRLFYD